MKTKLLTFLLALTFLFLFSDTSFSDNSKKEVKSIVEARKIISRFKDKITADISYLDKELKNKKGEFVEYYQSDVVGRNKNPEKHIIDYAIRWNNVDWDDDQDIIFWTEGISPSSWGGKEFVYVIIMENDNPLRIIGEALDPIPSRTQDKYQKSFFWNDPNKGCGYNNFVVGLLSYISYGASGSLNVRYNIFFNKHEQKIKFNKETSSVFLVPYDCSFFK
tara:strand:+ start:156 stop:815 length:660 start_codon:yes stop_codon:yes gene_type:complete